MIAKLLSRTAIGMVAAIPLLGLPIPLHAKDFIKAERPQQRGYSQAVITEGGKTVWLAGQTATVDDPASHWPATSRGKRGRSSSCSMLPSKKRAASSGTWCR